LEIDVYVQGWDLAAGNMKDDATDSEEWLECDSDQETVNFKISTDDEDDSKMPAMFLGYKRYTMPRPKLTDSDIEVLGTQQQKKYQPSDESDDSKEEDPLEKVVKIKQERDAAREEEEKAAAKSEEEEDLYANDESDNKTKEEVMVNVVPDKLKGPIFWQRTNGTQGQYQ
jgi:hypothetical protein